MGVSAKSLHCVLVAVVALACYLRTWDFGFTYVDDYQLILQSQTRLTEHGALLRAFTQPYFQQGAIDHAYYRPVVTTTYIFDAVLNGVHAHGYHLTNVLLHVAVAVLVFIWLRTCNHASVAALFGALAFALHPALAEAVAWIPGRSDVLMTGFAMIAWIAFRRDHEQPSLVKRLAHHLAWFLALLCKETALLLPMVWLLECRVLHHRSLRKLVHPGSWIGWTLVLTLYFGMRAAALQHAPGALGLGVGATSVSASLASAPVLITSLGKLMCPIQLSVLAIPRDTWLWPGMLTLIIGAVIWQRNIAAREGLVFAFAAYVLIMLPNLSASATLALENRLYLPLVPLVGLVTLATANVEWRSDLRVLVAGAIVALLAGCTLSYVDAFRDRRSFALAAVRGSPHSALAHKNLGLTAHAAGKIDRAEREYRTALKLDPSEPMAHNNLGSILGARRELAAAEREFRAEISVNPRYAPAHHNLAALLQATHRDDEAAIHWQASFESNPEDLIAKRALSAYYGSRQDPRAAQYRQSSEAYSKPSAR